MKAIARLRWVWIFTLMAAFLGTFLSYEKMPNLFAYRILLGGHLALFFIVWVWKRKEVKWGIFAKKYFIFLAFWFFWGMISLGWAGDQLLGIKNMYYLFSGICLVFFTVFYFRTESEMQLLWQVNLLILVFLVFLGLWELRTGLHIFGGFPHYYLGDSSLPLLGVFGHPNNFATYLTMFLPLLYAYGKSEKHYLVKVWCFAVLILGVHIIINSTSRANMLAMMVSTAFALFLFLVDINRRYFWRLLKIMGIIALIVVCLASILAFSDFVRKESQAFTEQVTSIFDQRENDSIAVRKVLVLNGLDMVRKSCGMGVGPGNSQFYMQEHIKETYGNVKLHNWWIEVMADYGIVVWALYLGFFGSMLGDLYHIFRTSSSPVHKRWAEGLLISLAGFSLGVISNGSMMASRHMWILYGLVICLINNFLDGKRLMGERQGERP